MCATRLRRAAAAARAILAAMQQHFVVQQRDLTVHRLITAEPPVLGDGEVELAIDRFGFTANNVTYAVLGEALGYWRFFPCDATWGRIPVWGFATVSRSAHAALAVGERCYGYWPMSSHLVVTPGRVDDLAFVDLAEHRRALPAIYNRYLRTARDPLYRSDTEPEQALLLGVFSTGFFLDDWIDDEPGFAGAAVVMTSASSKTAYSTAFQIARRGQREVIGLTSARNEAFVRRLGLYHRVIRYDQLEQLTPARAVYLDFAGDAAVRAAVHRQLGAALIHSSAIGRTHWQDDRGEPPPGPAPVPFFAPNRIAKRNRDWPGGGVGARIADAWHPFVTAVRERGWLTVVEDRGPDAVARVYDDALAGRTRPDDGPVLSLT
jgi:hypothetical protein